MAMEMFWRDSGKLLLHTVFILGKDTTENIRNHLLSRSM